MNAALNVSKLERGGAVPSTLTAGNLAPKSCMPNSANTVVTKSRKIMTFMTAVKEPMTASSSVRRRLTFMSSRATRSVRNAETFSDAANSW